MRFTRKPEHFISLGIAEMQGERLRFHDRHQEKFVPRSKYFWNGGDGALKMHQPGEVRS
jgi:hypothetical protein